jgi:ADP-heptose:LPS heptosyltransferase
VSEAGAQQARLLVFFARVGDLVMLTPCLRALAADAPLHLLARPWAAPLLAGQPFLAGIHGCAKPNVPRWRDWLSGSPRARLGASLGAMPWREILVFNAERASVKGWIDGWRGPAPLVELPIDHAAGGHMADRLADALRRTGYALPDGPAIPRLEVPPAALAEARARLAPLGRRVLALQAGSSLTNRWFRRQPNLKGLAPAVWAGALARLIAAGRADGAVLLGTAAERGEAQAVLEAVPAAQRAQVHDWTGRVPLGALPATLAACAGCLSVDTGPAHIAAAVGCPTLTVFGPSSAEVYGPRGPGPNRHLEGAAACRPCLGTRAFKRCRANVCLAGIGPEAVAEAWEGLNA